jgi:purine-nucleoside phosphorylase
MGRFSLAVFGRKTLPERCVIYAGAYVPSRKESIRPLFDTWRLVRGNWLPYAFASRQQKEFLVVFNVYGASMILEILHHLKDGGVRKVFFVGSMFAKGIPIGRLVLPTRVVDRAGIVLVDDPTRTTVIPGKSFVRTVKSALKRLNLQFVEANIASVPCVVHGIKRVTEFIDDSADIEGVEMEASTFLHFSKQLRLTSYVVLYVSDNERIDVISTAKLVRQARTRALRNITKVAFEVL